MATAQDVQQNGQLLQKLYDVMQYSYDTGAYILEKAQEPGTIQMTTQAGIRSLVGIAAIYHNPYLAGVGATVAVLRPDLVKQGCSMLEGAISGIWNRMSFNQKAAISTVGVASAFYFDPTKAFSILGSGFALKLGAELGLRNLKKEEIAAEVAAVAKKASEGEIDFKAE